MTILPLLLATTVGTTPGATATSTATSTAAGADAASPYDPRAFIDSQPVPDPAPTLRADEVVRDGVRYVRFTSDAGTIELPAVDRVTKEDLERALCAGEDAATVTGESRAARAATKLSERYVAYADLIVLTIKKRCGGGDRQVVLPLTGPDLELGIERQGKGRDPSRQKIFIRPGAATPQAGFGMDF